MWPFVYGGYIRVAKSKLCDHFVFELYISVGESILYILLILDDM